VGVSSSKKLILVLAIALAGGGVIIVVGTCIHKENPSEMLSANDQVFDFGRVLEGDVVTHEFTYHNRSSAVVRLIDTVESCSCMTPEGIPCDVAPGDTTRIRLSADTLARHGQTSMGVLVHTDAGVSLVFRLRGNVVPFCPREVPCGRVLRGRHSNVRFHAQNLEGRQLDVSRVQYDYEKVRVCQVREASHKVQIEATLRDSLPEGPFRIPITIATNHPRFGEVRVMLTGEVCRLVELDRSSIFVLGATANQAKTETIRLHSPYGKPVTMGDVVVSGDVNVSSTITRISKSCSDIRLEITGWDDPRSVIKTGVLTIEAKCDGQHRQFTVPLTVERYLVHSTASTLPQ